jgi:hypothetical protein
VLFNFSGRPATAATRPAFQPASQAALGARLPEEPSP